MFSPTTLEFIDKEIKRNYQNLDNIDKICKDGATKPSINETLLEERKYLLDKKSKQNI